MPLDSVVAGPRSLSPREGWGWLLLAALARAYLSLLATLAAVALLPMLFGLSGSVVQSGSMRPLINIGDVVLTQALPESAAAPMGRVIIFRAPVGSARPGTELHRLVAVNADGSLVTAGDANADPDSSSLKRSDILGQGRLLIPWIGLPSVWARTGAYGRLALWVIMTILAVIVLVLGPGKPGRASPAPDDLSGSALPRPGEAGAGEAASGHEVSTQDRSAIRPMARILGTLLIVGVLSTPPLGMTSAAFSAGTVSIGNSWSAGTWPTHLAFTTHPSGSTGGIAFATQPVISVRDGAGVTIPGSAAPVTLSLTTPGSAALTCATNPVTAVAGVARFAGCTVDKVGTYSLTATSTGLAKAVSASFTITVGPAAKLGFTVDPSSSAVSTSFGTQPRVAIQDAGGNTRTTSSASVKLTITPPTGGATLTCSTNPRNTSSGIATFSSCRINRAGTYTLTATATGLTAAVSRSFIVFGAASKLAFTTNPSGATGGSGFVTQPVVAVQDTGGNTVASSSASVTLTITNPAGATLTCITNPRAAASGVATFTGCRIDRPGTYTLTATATGLTSAVSTSLTIT